MPGATCPHCGETNLESSRRCAHCGQPIGPALSRDEWSSPGEEATPTPATEPVHADDDSLRREHFVQALFRNTPHTFVTWTVIALNIAVFLLMAVRGKTLGAPDVATSLAWGASYGPAITTHGEWWRLLSGTFVHAGIIHIAANMYVLAVMGPITERLYGNATYAVLYLLAALTGSVASVWWHPLVPSVGASGAVFGVMGGVLAYTLRQRRSMPPAILRSVGSGVGQTVAINLVINLATPHIDMAAHVGGLLGGFGFGLFLAGPLDETMRRKIRRAAVIAAAGIVLVVIVARQLPRYDDWLGILARYTRVEADTFSRLDALIKQTQPDQKSRDRVATAITDRILPPWMALRNEMARLRLPPAEHALAAQQVRYMDLRAEAWRLSAEGYRTNDLHLVKQSREKTAEAMTLQARMLGRVPSAQPKDDALDAAIAWQEALGRMSAADNKATTAYNNALKQTRSNRITPQRFAQIIETTVIPAAREAASAVAMTLPTADLKAQQQQVAEYTRLRLESWELRARALREDSVDLMREANRKQAAAEAAAKQTQK